MIEAPMSVARPDDLSATLAQLESRLGPRNGEPVVMSGGMTNHNLRVGFGGRDCVVRIAGNDTALLGIDRRCEHMATAAAAESGVGPEVLAFLDDPPCLVTAFVEGRVLARGDVAAPDVIAEAAVALWAVHAGAPIPSLFSPWAVINSHHRRAAERGAHVPGVFSDLQEGARQVERVLDPGHPEHAPVPCHNDLHPSNLIQDGERIRIVDWEHAGMGNRYFDLGNLSVNNAFSEAGDEWLLECYWGEPCTRGRMAAVRLMRIMSDFREAMWAVLHATVSELDFDFSGYAQEHFERASAGFADPRFPVWLQDAAGA